MAGISDGVEIGLIKLLEFFLLLFLYEVVKIVATKLKATHSLLPWLCAFGAAAAIALIYGYSFTPDYDSGPADSDSVKAQAEESGIEQQNATYAFILFFGICALAIFTSPSLKPNPTPLPFE